MSRHWLHFTFDGIFNANSAGSTLRRRHIGTARQVPNGSLSTYACRRKNLNQWRAVIRILTLRKYIDSAHRHLAQLPAA